MPSWAETMTGTPARPTAINRYLNTRIWTEGKAAAVPPAYLRLSGPSITMSVHRLLPLLGIFSLMFASCKKESNTTAGGVPFNQVDIQININNPAYNDLAVPGGWLYLTGGSLGIIVYRNTIDTFTALDRHCPYQPQDLCQVAVDSTEITARDADCCGSAFLIIDGSVTQGPSALGLQQYNTTFNGTTLRIFN